MDSTNSSAPASNLVPLFAAITLALFFVPIKIGLLGGIALAPSDIASLLSLGFVALVILEGKTHKLFHPCIGFLLLFTSYVFINGMLNRGSARYPHGPLRLSPAQQQR